MISALFLERVCQYSSLCAIRTDWRIQRNVYRIGTRSVWDYRIWQNIIPTKQVHSILLVTLCNKFILILQPNLISNVSILGQWIHTTIYLIFQFSMGYGHCFVSIFHLWLHFFSSYYDNKFILIHQI